MKKTVLFIGELHRSKASAFAGSATLLGGGQPPELIGTGPGDPEAHFESTAVASANDKFLASVGRTWFDLRPMPAIDAALNEIATNRFAQILDEDFSGTSVSVVQDPRTCLLARQWIGAAQRLKARPVFVALLRHPAECASSLMERDGFGFADAVAVWLRYMLDFEIATRSESRFLVIAEQFLDSPSDVLKAVSMGLDFEWSQSPDTANAEISSFVARDLMSGRITESCPEMGLAEEVYDLWLQPESAGRAAAFDRLRQEFDAAAPDLYASLVQRQLDLVLPLRWDRDRLKKQAVELKQQTAELLARVEQEKPAHVVLASEETRRRAPPHEVRDRAASYLGKPLRNLIKFKSARLLAKAPLLSEQRRARLIQSAAKRDHHLLSGQIRQLITASRDEASQGTGFDQTDYANSLAPRRRDVLGSPAHVALHAAVWNPDIGSLPKITISFVTYNSAQWLKGLFASLLAQAYPLDRLNLCFIDHGSDDATLALVADFVRRSGSLFHSVKLEQQPNLGFGAGHDVAIRASDDQFVLVSNVDLEFHADTLVRLVAAALADDTDVACWEARQCPCEHPKYYDPVTLETAWSSHACILLRKDAYAAAGGYEKRIFMYGEDVELSYRFRGAGYRLRYLPQAAVTHFVDFDDTTLRPHQLSGSVAANVLLRHRYGSDGISKEGDELLAHAISGATNPARRDALIEAQRIVSENLDHFRKEFRPAQSAIFPFHDFVYDIARSGHDVTLPAPTWGADAPLVSIVTRTHGDHTEFLNEAIASVLNQTYPYIEHIIVEDRSDAARELVEAAKSTYGSNIRYLKSDGIERCAAGNAGLAAAQGDFLMFLDADDLLFCDHVELIVGHLVAQAETVAAYSLAWEVPTFFSASGRYREGAPVIPPSHLGPFSIDRLAKGNFIPIQAIMFRRTLFERAGGFELATDPLEDWHLWSRYAALGDFHMIPKVTSLYRTPGDPYFRQQRTTVMLTAEARVRKLVQAIFSRSQAAPTEKPMAETDATAKN